MPILLLIVLLDTYQVHTLPMQPDETADKKLITILAVGLAAAAADVVSRRTRHRLLFVGR